MCVCVSRFIFLLDCPVPLTHWAANATCGNGVVDSGEQVRLLFRLVFVSQYRVRCSVIVARLAVWASTHVATG